MERANDGGPTAATFNVLFVCTGNTCRSPMAEIFARDEIERRGWTHVRVSSAGIAADPGVPAAPHAVTVTRRQGLDLTPHLSRPLDPDLVEWADVILAMSPSHLGAIAELGGEHKMGLLGEFAAELEGGGRPVGDPFGGDEAEYEATAQELRVLVRRSMDRLAPILQP